MRHSDVFNLARFIDIHTKRCKWHTSLDYPIIAYNDLSSGEVILKCHVCEEKLCIHYSFKLVEEEKDGHTHS